MTLVIGSRRVQPQNAPRVLGCQGSYSVMRKSFLYMFAGAALGVTVPLGALGLLWLSPHPALQLPHFLVGEWKDHLFFFTYMLAGSTLSFGVFGFFLGRDSDIIEDQNRHLELLADRDELTGLGNHRLLHKVFKAEYVRHLASLKPISCLMMDLDHFKKINDTYGHIFGDCVLKDFARLMENSLRKGDVATRYGGEEFLCVLPDCSRKKAREVAERIRRRAQKKAFLQDEIEAWVTVSVGAVTSYGVAMDYPKLIALADQALYQAKRRGRNRVVQNVLVSSKKAGRPGGKFIPRPSTGA